MRALVEIETIDRGTQRDVGDVLGALLLRDPATRVVLDASAEVADALVGCSLGLLVGQLAGQESLDESVGEFGGAHSLQSGVRRPTRQAGTTSGHRAEARDRLDSQRVERLLITVSKRLLQSRTEVLEGGGVVA